MIEKAETFAKISLGHTLIRKYDLPSLHKHPFHDLSSINQNCFFVYLSISSRTKLNERPISFNH